MEKQKIRFINSNYKTLFYIDDGGEIEIFFDGEWNKRVCRYLDECHTEIGGYIYHICEFAERMEQLNQPYRPVISQPEPEITSVNK